MVAFCPTAQWGASAATLAKMNAAQLNTTMDESVRLQRQTASRPEIWPYQYFYYNNGRQNDTLTPQDARASANPDWTPPSDFPLEDDVEFTLFFSRVEFQLENDRVFGWLDRWNFLTHMGRPGLWYIIYILLCIYWYVNPMTDIEWSIYKTRWLQLIELQIHTM
jgi:hypothetical protein